MKELERWNRYKYIKKCVKEAVIVLFAGCVVFGVTWLVLIGADRLIDFVR